MQALVTRKNMVGLTVYFGSVCELILLVAITMLKVNGEF